MTDYVNPVPDNRTIVPGAWSDLLDKQLSAHTTAAVGTVSVSISDVNSVAQAVLNGAMHSVNNEFTLLAGESVGFKIRAAGGTFVRFANADGLTIKYVTSFTGLLLLLGSSRSLNLSVDNGYRAFYDKFKDPVFAESDVILSGQAPINAEVFSEDDVFIVVKNNTSNTVTDSFSAGLQSVGAFTAPYGLTASTALTAITEMIIYD
tara:strand:+ start:207 stop:821 length:615 start_codon:yes stop_codon:yes gene_type:complete